MKKPTIVLLLLFAVIYSYAQQIKAYEYWVDDDVSAKVVTSIAPVQTLHLQQELSVSLVSAGFHVFNIRFADTNNTWSSILSQFFVRNPQANSDTRQIVGYEYWFDDSYALTTYRQTSPAVQFHLADNLSLNSLSYGFHVLNIRFKDDLGSWSTVLSQFFVNNPASNGSNRQIVGYEYWFDNGNANKTYQQITPSAQFHLADNLNMNSVTPGLHLLNIRFKDDMGSWSSLLTQFFTNYGAPRIIPNKTVAYRFWFDNDMATQETFNLQPPAAFYNWADTVETPFLAIGNHTFNYQFKDSNQVFSSIRTDTFSVASCLPHGGRAIAGAASVCVGQTGVVYSIRKIKNAAAYTWSVPSGAAIVAGSNTHSITVDYSMASVSGEVSVYATNSCGNGGALTFPVTVNPLPVPAISGPASVCATSTGNVYSTQTGMTGYLWSVSAGGTITAGTGTRDITVTWNTAGAQTVSVNYTNANSCTAAVPTVYNVTVNPLPVPAISGPASVCATSTGNVYSTQTGMTGYLWSVSAGGTITAGTGTRDITVTWNTAGAQTVSVNYTNANSCTAAAPTVYDVTVNPLPVPAISGPVSACVTSTGNAYSTQAGMTGYLWTVSAGGIITAGTGTRDITVTWNTAGAQTVSVNYTNANSCTAAAPTGYDVTVNPLPVPAISGPVSACVTSTGNAYSTQAGMTGYLWTVSAGGIITSGTGTRDITVTWNTAGAQTVSVNYTNANSCTAAAPTVYNVTVNPFPGASGSITGPAQVIQGQTSVGYSVNLVDNATGYAWTLPPGAIIATGENTNSINVDFGTAAVSGDILVHGTNACGSGAESQSLNVRVIPTAISIENVSIGNLEANCYSAAQTIFAAGNGTSFEVQTGGSATLIAGQNIIFRPTVKVALGGSMHGYITSSSEYCGTQKTPMVAVVTGEQEPVIPVTGASFKVYPNPTTGSFTLEFADKSTVGRIDIAIYSMHGEKLLNQEMTGERSLLFSLSGRPPGVYIIHVLTGNTAETVKVIKQ